MIDQSIPDATKFPPLTKKEILILDLQDVLNRIKTVDIDNASIILDTTIKYVRDLDIS